MLKFVNLKAYMHTEEFYDKVIVIIAADTPITYNVCSNRKALYQLT